MASGCCVSASGQAFSYSYTERADSAERYIKAERWEDAERNLKGALRLEPGNPGNALLLSNLGYVQTQLDRLDDAIESYTVSLAIAPRSAVVLSNRAMAYAAANRPAEALADLDAALSIDSTRTMPLKMRGLLRLDRGDCAGARHDFNLLVKFAPSEAAAYEGIARCDIAEDNTDSAISMIRKAIELEAVPERYFLLASLQLDSERLSDAADTLREGIKAFPRTGDLYLLRARLHKLNYRPEDAESDKKTAIKNGADPQLVQLIFPGK